MLEILIKVIEWLINNESLPQSYKLIGLLICLVLVGWYMYYATITFSRRGVLLKALTEEAEELGEAGKPVRAGMALRESGQNGKKPLKAGEVKELIKFVNKARKTVNQVTENENETKTGKGGLKLWRKIREALKKKKN